MIKKSKSISINILSAFIILLCLFIGVVHPTNAWFTDSHKEGVQIEIEIGDLKLKVYQNSIAQANEIFSNEMNLEYETDKLENGSANTSTNPKYVNLGGEILPETPVTLKLILANQDKGSASMFVRFKFELFIREIGASDTKIEGVTIAGFTTPTASKAGFVEDGEYYYYRNNQNQNTLFAKDDTADMLQSFTVPMNAFVGSNGEMLITNSETIYIKLTIDGSTSSTFAV